jgi:hypothetical protein
MIKVYIEYLRFNKSEIVTCDNMEQADKILANMRQYSEIVAYIQK